MYPVSRYLRPGSLQEAIALLQEYPGSRPIAGGTDLLVALKEKGVHCDTLVDLKGIPGLGHLRESEDGSVEMGALVTIAELLKSPVIRQRLPLLASAASLLGSYQVRQRATLGGNLCNASPAAETACPLLAMDARVRLVGPRGERVLRLADFFRAPGQTALERAEVLVGVECPGVADREGARYGGMYLKLGPRQAMDIAVVNVAVWLGVAGGRCVDARIALGAVGPVPFRARDAEEALVGRPLDAETIERAAVAAQQAARPIDDIRASAWYRREMVRNLVTRALSGTVAKVGRPDRG